MSNILHTKAYYIIHKHLTLTPCKKGILWAQSVDRPDSWIALRNLWILTSRRNPWIAQDSCLRDLWILPNFGYTNFCNKMLDPTTVKNVCFYSYCYNRHYIACTSCTVYTVLHDNNLIHYK